jgi:hypothetical protein
MSYAAALRLRCLVVQLTWFATSLNSTAAIGPEAVLQLKTLSTKKGRTNPSLTGPKTLLNETI